MRAVVTVTDLTLSSHPLTGVTEVYQLFLKRPKRNTTKMPYEKRTRGIRTSNSQYEIYLNYLEHCEPLRTNTVGPGMPSRIIHDKWEELASLLNNCDHGPILTASEWRTRFTNWRNTTKLKYRNFISEKNGSAGLSDIEERGLRFWSSSMAVTCMPDISFEMLNKPLPQSEEKTSYVHPQQEDQEVQKELPVSAQDIAIKLLQSKNSNHANVYEVNKHKLIVEKVRLQFEIAKYKFENPNFEFDSSELDELC